MHVAISAWFWNQPMTGSGQYVRRLVDHLPTIAPDIEITLIAPFPIGLPAEAPRIRAVETPRAGFLRGGNIGKVKFEQVTFPRTCVRIGADVAHVPYWASPLRPRVPTLVTIHDLIPLLLPEYRKSWLVRAYTALVNQSTHAATSVLTDSQASKQDIVTYLKLAPSRVRTVYLAADAPFRPEPDPRDAAIRRHYGLPGRYILYLGGFDVRKNISTLLKAYGLAQSALGPVCPLVIAGRLPEKDSAFTPDPLRLAGEYDVDTQSVYTTGFVEEADKPALYRGATAMAFPSRYEGFGLPVLEAMACGTPVLGARASSIPEIVGSGGLLISPDDVDGLAHAMVRITGDAALRNELSQLALARAKQFTWQETARATLTAYTDAVHDASAG
ncbi:MAG: glycosyltransferase family 4 protein [Chloroflexi bacterium]|nr:glycosyltransferase family 4 protein [Chloroflexota bacterium]